MTDFYFMQNYHLSVEIENRFMMLILTLKKMVDKLTNNRHIWRDLQLTTR
jgi:hypothetical protein